MSSVVFLILTLILHSVAIGSLSRGWKRENALYDALGDGFTADVLFSSLPPPLPIWTVSNIRYCGDGRIQFNASRGCCAYSTNAALAIKVTDAWGAGKEAAIVVRRTDDHDAHGSTILEVVDVVVMGTKAND